MIGRRPSPLRDEQGQVTLLIVGFASILLMAIVTLIDASAAYLQRQGLDNLADGAALYGADLGSAGVYEQGLDAPRLTQQEAAVEAAVRAYLTKAGAEGKYPGIEVGVRVDPVNRSVTVRLEAPLHLPLTIPGSPSNPKVTASSTAAVTVQPTGG
ncbi:Tad domain-containing protein [Nocardioides astragali]|uniref:Tad domain-containing protein n=1 Tax=Nocardioides astragali TaxID=1776736 RepID=A0ABW2N5K5_9ACTN|nr:Tad domain-containing protein [Nocardioides astragali]